VAEFETAEVLVEKILEEKPSTRFSDYNLFVEVVRRLNRKLLRLPVEEFFRAVKHKENGVPKYETVTRCRRKIQAKRPELKEPHTAQKRAERETEFKDYARS
jgi:hypothetical protein